MRYFIIFCTLLAAPAFAAGSANRCAMFSKTTGGSASQRLNQFFETQWTYLMTEFPEFATFVGYPGQNDRWSDQSPEAFVRHDKEVDCMLEALKKIPRASLTGEDRVSYDLSMQRLTLDVEGRQFPDRYIPLSQREGFQVDAASVLTAMPTAKADDYENIVKRLEAFPQVIANTRVLMLEGLKREVSPVKSFLPKVLPQLDQLMSETVEDSPLYEKFKEMNVDIPKDEQLRLQNRAKSALIEKVYPALKAFKEFLATEYIPKAREYTGLSELPNGAAWYAFRVKTSTTTNRTPEELHQLGLSEVARITKAMNEVREQVKFKGDLKAFNKFLLTDKRFQYKDKESLLAGYRDIAKRIDPELPKLFKTLPRITYGVRPIPDYAAPTSAGGQYQPGSIDSGRAGWFEANTYDLPSRPSWQMETLMAHEGVPGHHFQISIAQEVQNLPKFRRWGGYTAFDEGWALYAESLGYEIGLYKDGYAKYGNLSDEMMRAVRLVVDTGMHAKGWSKQQALDYYRAQFPTSDVDSLSEIERYISWPAQALAYKVGQLKFRELREKAKGELGEKFDVREFHDEVLRHGALPMDVLEKTVQEWVQAQKKKAKVRHV